MYNYLTHRATRPVQIVHITFDFPRVSVISPWVNPHVGVNYGEWGPWARCAPGHYVAGVKLRIKNDGYENHKDDAGLTIMRLICDPGNPTTLTSAESTTYWKDKERNKLGDWKEYLSNIYPIVGIWLQSQDLQPKIDTNNKYTCDDTYDNMAVTGLRFLDSYGMQHKPGKRKCDYSIELDIDLSLPLGEADPYDGETWGYSECPEGSSIVGFRTKQYFLSTKWNRFCDQKGITKAEFLCRRHWKPVQTPGRLGSAAPPR